MGVYTAFGPRPRTQVQAALSETQVSSQATPTFKGSKARVRPLSKASQPKGQPAMATPTTKEDTHQQVLKAKDSVVAAERS